MELPLCDSAVSKIASGDSGPILELVRQGQSDRDRLAASHNRVAAIETATNIEEVRRAAMAAAAACHLSEHLCHQNVRGHRGRSNSEQRRSKLQANSVGVGTRPNPHGGSLPIMPFLRTYQFRFSWAPITPELPVI